MFHTSIITDALPVASDSDLLNTDPQGGLMTKKDKIAIGVALAAGVAVGATTGILAYGIFATGTLLALYGVMGVGE